MQNKNKRIVKPCTYQKWRNENFHLSLSIYYALHIIFYTEHSEYSEICFPFLLLFTSIVWCGAYGQENNFMNHFNFIIHFTTHSKTSVHIFGLWTWPFQFLPSHSNLYERVIYGVYPSTGWFCQKGEKKAIHGMTTQTFVHTGKDRHRIAYTYRVSGYMVRVCAEFDGRWTCKPDKKRTLSSSKFIVSF